MEPVFVVGNPRSGTTLLRLLIGSHPNICIAPECGFALWLEKDYSDWSRQNLEEPQSVTKFVKDLCECRKFDTWMLPREQISAMILDRKPTTYSELVAAVYEAYLAHVKPEATCWGDKNNFHVQHIMQLNSLFPQSKFVHIVRDVRDVACSYRELKSLKSDSPYRPNLPFSVDEICHQWKTNVEAVLDDFEKIDGCRAMNIRYEDIVTDPVASCLSICKFLGQDYSSEMLEFYQRDLEPHQTMDWKQKTTMPVSTISLERFRRDLTLEDVSLANQKCADLLSRFGYPVE